MKDLVDYIIKQLVTNPDEVSVEEETGDGSVNLIIHVHPDDMGIVIGKSGQTIKAIRKILTIRAMAEQLRVNLQIAEPQNGASPSEE